MTAGLRLTITALPMALAAALFAMPVAAQNSTQPAPASNGVIGPSELRDFSLTGPVTRTAPPAVPPSQPQEQRPGTRPTQSPGGETVPPTAAPPPTRVPPRSTGAAAVEGPAPRAAAPASDPSSSITFALPSTDPVPSPTASASEAPSLGSQPGLVAVEPPASASIPVDSGPPLWPWLVAALAAGLAVVYYGMRQRARPIAAGDAPMAFARPEPAAGTPARAPSAEPRARPLPAPPPEPPASSKIPGMIVATRLRPRLDIQFMPERMIVDSERATLQFGAIVLNSGNAPARDVRVEAAMFNAGGNQDEQIGGFFSHPFGRGDPVAEIMPLKAITLRSEVVLPVGQLRLFEVEGRRLFVPLVALNALYRWGDKSAQTSESFIVGVDTQGERMGPFRLDGTPRQFRHIAARPHSARLRK